MDLPALYRRRLIPEECIHLKDDEIVLINNHIIVTKWNTLKPKKDLHHGISCYYLDQGYKVSKFYDHNNQLLYWYCDIIEYTYDQDMNTYCFTDLLADVIIYPDGFVKVVDLDEIADALENNQILVPTVQSALRKLNNLLEIIYSGNFQTLQDTVESFE